MVDPKKDTEIMNAAGVVPPAGKSDLFSDLLIIKTSDGVVQSGYALLSEGKVHDWFIRRAFVKGKYVPDSMGEDFSIGCFDSGNLKVEGWLPMPSMKEMMKVSQKKLK